RGGDRAWSQWSRTPRLVRPASNAVNQRRKRGPKPQKCPPRPRTADWQKNCLLKPNRNAVLCDSYQSHFYQEIIAMHMMAELPIDNSSGARNPAMSPVQDGRQAARIFALTAGILFGVIFVLQAVSF